MDTALALLKIIDLGAEVFDPCVNHESNDCCVWSKPLGEPQCGNNIGT